MALSFKIGMLALKTLAKPFASSIKTHTKSHLYFAEQVMLLFQEPRDDSLTLREYVLYMRII
jgi:uncharacterized membrane protein